MTLQPSVIVDHRDAEEVFAQLVKRRIGYTPGWLAAEGDPGVAVARIFSRYFDAVLRRLNQAPDKNKLAFQYLLGLTLTPAQAARAPVVFTLAAGATDITAPAGTQLSATPGQNGTAPLVFETEQAVAVASASLTHAASLWPGRDQYVDHSADLATPRPFTLFDPAKLTNVPHAIYIANKVLLALAGKTSLEVQFDVSQPGQEPLDLRWEYWDGDIWRQFKENRPACAAKGAPIGDSTNGLTESGRYLLETECAESAPLAINGVTNFWIRGVLDEPLMPATDGTSRKATCSCSKTASKSSGQPGNDILPVVETIRLSNTIHQPVILDADAQYVYTADVSQFFGITPVPIFFGEFGTPHFIRVRVVNEGGEYLPGVTLTAKFTALPNTITIITSAAEQFVSLQPPPGGGSILLELMYQGLTVEVDSIPLAADTAILVTLKLRSLPLDQAFADGTALDLTKPFFPFGQQPGPGSTFYFSNAEIFSKPGAKFQLFFARTQSATDAIDISTDPIVPADRTPLCPTVAWEYWNGREWAGFFTSQTLTMDQTDTVDITVPDDIEKTKVNDVEALWMRVRIVSGTFGFTQTVRWNAGDGKNRFTYVIVQPPALSSIGLGYSWQYGPFPPQRVFTYNFFRYADHTEETLWPGLTFPIFERIPDTTPALYLGFSKKLPVDSMGLLFDLVEDDDSSIRPPLTWEYWNGADWRKLSSTDETRDLGLPGILQFIGSEDAKSSSLFGVSRYWIRGRLKEDEPPPKPVIKRIYTNSTWATERRTLVNVSLGASNGAANQTFLFMQTPILEGEQIEVRELAGARANVEWRILARELAGGDTRLMLAMERLLSKESPATDVQSGPLRLVRDRTRNVVEAWTTWKSRPFLYLSGPSDRDYAIDRARGVVLFGDGLYGRILPAGAQVRAAQVRVGGGTPGNVAIGAIGQLLGPLAGVQSVTNPTPAEGGADRESMTQYQSRASRTLRHRGRAVTPGDYETMAKESSPAIGFVRAIPNRNDAGRTVSGWVTLIIIPESTDSRPYPSFGLREHVQQYIMARMPADVAALSRILITGPHYFAVDVTATIASIDPSDAGIVEERVRAAIEAFLHPLHGGPEGRGWELGRDVFLSDVAANIEQVEGVDYAQEIRLLLEGVPQGEQVRVFPGHMVVAGKIRINMIAAERQKALLLSAGGEGL